VSPTPNLKKKIGFSANVLKALYSRKDFGFCGDNKDMKNKLNKG